MGGPRRSGRSVTPPSFSVPRQVDALELAYAGVARQAELIRSREISPVELLETYLRRIERLEPRLNAFRIIFPERALAEARQAEGRRGAGGGGALPRVPG